MFDKDNKIVLLNDQYTRLYDLPNGLIDIGDSPKTILRFQAERGDFGEGEAEELAEQVMQRLSSGEVMSYERHLFNGNIVEINISPTPDGSTIAIYNDITQRKQAEIQLQDAFSQISSSIDYASRIQRSVLPDDTLFASLLSDYFVIWEPRDVVGGDIYWCRLWGDGLLIILGDCTGHGVPGAFMTLIATGALDRAMSDIPNGQVGNLLQKLHQMVQLTLGQHSDHSQSDDGMELGMCYLAPDLDRIIFSGARFELHLIENGHANVIKGTKSGIGYHGISFDQIFDEHEIINLKEKSFYMTSDGMIDQIGGEKGRMFGKKRLKELLLEHQDKPMSEQKELIHQALIDYQGEQNRRDDVAVIGFRV